jgi:UDP-2,4-diacetamido-2,4,6-trideoxy-beta-L-altropyranose hydrolase
VRVAFRVDAGPLIGGGHAMRCLTLADALAERGAQATFVTASMPEVLADRISASGHSLVRIPASSEQERQGYDWHEQPLDDEAQRADVEASTGAIGSTDWLVIDHYLLDIRWHAASRSFAGRVLVIDDLANRQYDCDLLLDQTHGRSPADYRPLLPDHTKIAAGSAYALLRPEFARERPAALRGRREAGLVRRIVVSLGTTDPGSITAAIVERVLHAAAKAEIDVVLGPDAPSLPHVRDVASANSRVTIHIGTNRMAELMRDADLAVGAAGATSWERCCLGLPSIAFVLADNQRKIAQGLAEAGAHIVTDETGLEGALKRLLTDGDLRQRMSAAAFAITDGLGASRMVDTIEGRGTKSERVIRMRDANADDRELIWLWRNDSGTRLVSRTKEAIPWTAHGSWFSSVMNNPNRHLLIAEADGSPVAVVRFDRLESQPGAFEVSINVRADARSSGLGRLVLSTACAEFVATQCAARIVASVAEGNQPSRRLFEACGFLPAGVSDAQGFAPYVWEAKSAALGGRMSG